MEEFLLGIFMIIVLSVLASPLWVPVWIAIRIRYGGKLHPARSILNVGDSQPLPARVCSTLALNAARRTEADVRHQFRRHLYTLITIAITAPMIGAIATLWQSCYALVCIIMGCGGECCAGGLSEAMVLFLMSLFVAIPALAAHQILRAQLERLDTSMHCAVLDLTTYLHAYSARTLLR